MTEQAAAFGGGLSKIRELKFDRHLLRPKVRYGIRLAFLPTIRLG